MSEPAAYLFPQVYTREKYLQREELMRAVCEAHGCEYEEAHWTFDDMRRWAERDQCEVRDA